MEGLKTEFINCYITVKCRYYVILELSYISLQLPKSDEHKSMTVNCHLHAALFIKHMLTVQQCRTMVVWSTIKV